MFLLIDKWVKILPERMRLAQESEKPVKNSDWKQLLAASLQKPSNFELQLSAEYCVLESSIAESANWKLSLAESSKEL